jgi:type I restriction enzyme S subunit
VTYKKVQAKTCPTNGFLPLLRATNISQELDFDNLVYVPRRNVSDLQILREGDVVIAASSGSKSVVGKGAVLKSAWTGTFGAFCAVSRPSETIAARYLSYYLQTQEYRNYISACSAGVNINNLKASDLESFELKLAPRDEQDRIVAEIEKQFTRLDAATAALKRVQVNLKRYRASVLKAACEGRLVPTEAELARMEGRDYEPAEKLLQRILHERRARWEAETLAKMQASGKPPKDNHWKQKYKEPSASDTTNLPPLPEGWCWASLDQLAVSVRNGISVKPTLEQGLAILRISAVRAMSVNLDDVRFLPDSPEFRQYALSENDLLFVRYNGNPDLSGRCGRVGITDGTIVHPDKLIRVDICFKFELSGWVEIAANFGVSRRHLELKTRTTAANQGFLEKTSREFQSRSARCQRPSE